MLLLSLEEFKLEDMKTNTIKMFSGAAVALSLCALAPAARAMDMPATMEFKQELNQNLDALFMVHSYQGNMAEVMAGKLALQRAKDPMVKMVARTIIKDHGTANRDLLGHFKAMNMTVPTDPGVANKAVYDHLKTLRGSAFDKAYISCQVGAHEGAIVLFSHEVDSGKNATIKAYAMNKLPHILGHTAELYATAAKVGAPGLNLRPAPVKDAAMKAAQEQMKM